MEENVEAVRKRELLHLPWLRAQVGAFGCNNLSTGEVLRSLQVLGCFFDFVK